MVIKNKAESTEELLNLNGTMEARIEKEVMDNVSGEVVIEKVVKETFKKTKDGMFCPTCQKPLGMFDGKTITGYDGISVKEGIVYFACSTCGTEIEVCPNNLEFALIHKHLVDKYS